MPRPSQTYDPSQAACGYGNLLPSEWPFGAVAAIDPAASPFAAGVQEGCGVCLEVQCADPSQCGSAPDSSLVVQVIDHCTGCGAAAVYLAPEPFSRLKAGGLGQVPARFRQVCRLPPGADVLYRTNAMRGQACNQDSSPHLCMLTCPGPLPPAGEL